MSGKRQCGCYCGTDARTCYDLRIYGHSPINRGPNARYDLIDSIAGEPEPDYLDDGVCECACHDDEEDA